MIHSSSTELYMGSRTERCSCTEVEKCWLCHPINDYRFSGSKGLYPCLTWVPIIQHLPSLWLTWGLLSEKEQLQPLVRKHLQSYCTGAIPRKCSIQSYRLRAQNWHCRPLAYGKYTDFIRKWISMEGERKNNETQFITSWRNFGKYFRRSRKSNSLPEKKNVSARCFFNLALDFWEP